MVPVVIGMRSGLAKHPFGGGGAAVSGGVGGDRGWSDDHGSRWAVEGEPADDSIHTWLARYEQAGLEGLPDRSYRPGSCPHQMPAAVEVAVLELRRSRPYWGARRIALELARRRSHKSRTRCRGFLGILQIPGHAS